jgi:crossover junction endodeoxyribonuclease RuvC
MSNSYLKFNKLSGKIILGIDPGTSVSGFGVIGITGTTISLIDVGHWNIKKTENHFDKLKQIIEEIEMIIEHYKPDEMAIEAPFYGKNIQSMLKLGRAQGVAIAAALNKGVQIFEYSPKKIKQSITGNGNASKEQVAAMLSTILHTPIINESLDATDALGVAICHHFQSNTMQSESKYSGWGAFLKANPGKVK